MSPFNSPSRWRDQESTALSLTCDAKIRHYHDEVIACPTFLEHWLEIEQDFR